MKCSDVNHRANLERTGECPACGYRVRIKHFGYNVQPVCDSPVDGCMSTGGGLRLCVNPKHQDDPSYQIFGPVWHEQKEWQR